MDHCFTISPPYRLCDPEALHKKYTIDIARELNKFSRHYCLYPEFDDNQRLHYHGIVRVHDKIKMYKIKHKLDMIGWTKIVKPDDFINKLRYLIYCQKQYAEIQEHYPPIIYMRQRRRLLLCKVTEEACIVKKPNIMDFFNSLRRIST